MFFLLKEKERNNKIQRYGRRLLLAQLNILEEKSFSYCWIRTRAREKIDKPQNEQTEKQFGIELWIKLWRI